MRQAQGWGPGALPPAAAAGRTTCPLQPPGRPPPASGTLPKPPRTRGVTAPGYKGGAKRKQSVDIICEWEA